MYSAFHCSDYYGNSVAMSVATDLGNPQFMCVTEHVSCQIGFSSVSAYCGWPTADIHIGTVLGF